MNCKNCKVDLVEEHNYCPHCGAEVVRERISTQNIFKNFASNFFGWDNKFFFTIKSLLLSPGKVLGEYLGGTRKKYVAPFTILTFGMFLTMLVFNQFADEYLAMNEEASLEQAKMIEHQFGIDKDPEAAKKFEAQQLQINADIQKNTLKYFNFFTFLLVPVYTLMAKWVFGKQQNYAEHLVINCYIQGVSFLAATLFFIASLFIHPGLYGLSILFTVVYYLYAYADLNQYSIGQVFIKLLKFIGIGVLFGLVLFVLGALLGGMGLVGET